MTVTRSRLNLRRIENRRSRLEKYLNGIIGLTIIILVMGFGWMSSMFISEIYQKNLRLALELSLKHIAREIHTLKPQVDQLQQEVNALVDHVMPNLIPIRTGQPIAIETRFVSNITFDFAETGNGRHLKYRLVAQNTAKFAVSLRLDLIFFGHKGLRIGVSHLGGAGSINPTILERGDLRVVSAPIEITARGFSDGDIRYFKLQFPE